MALLHRFHCTTHRKLKGKQDWQNESEIDDFDEPCILIQIDQKADEKLRRFIEIWKIKIDFIGLAILDI